MKLEQIQFRKSIKILQVFCNINYYGKTEKSFQDRKETMAWREIPSTNGHVIDNELYLPESILKKPRF